MGLYGAHRLRALFRIVFVAQKMQNAVHQQQRDLVFQRPATRGGLTRRCIQRDGDISQGILAAQGRRLLLRPGKDIRRTIDPTPLAVQRMDTRIVG